MGVLLSPFAVYLPAGLPSFVVMALFLFGALTKVAGITSY
jgi:hypothetical protein